MTTNIKKSSSVIDFWSKSVFILNTVFIVLNNGQLTAQSSNINSNMIYAMNGMTIQYYDPSQPQSSSNPANSNISLPAGAAGLAICDGMSGPGPSTRFYTTLLGIYHYWDGSNWVNTGHTTGDPGAVNIGGGGGYIYNLNGSTGDIYKYDGSGNGQLITSLPSFAGGGPYDMVVDNNGNFYILQTTIPQSLKVFNPNGQQICSYNLVGMPSLFAGGGFAIIGNQLYVHNGAFYTGTFTGSDIIFNSIPSPLNNPNDFASSSFNYVDVIQASISNAGTLGCSSQTVSATVITDLSAANFYWSGPGIISSSPSGDITVNLPGLYSCTVTPALTIGCPIVVSTSVISIGTAVTPNISESNSLSCTNNNAQLSTTLNPALHTYTWTGNGIVSGSNSQTTVINSGGIYSLQVQNTLTGCTGTSTINVAPLQNTLSISVNDATICQGNSTSLIVNGNATSYEWSACSSLNTTVGSTVIVNPLTCTIYTVTGTLGACTATAISNVTVNSAPTISVSPSIANICAGLSGATFTASGADNYVWSNSSSLSSTNGSIATANPSTTTVYQVIGSTNTCTSSTTFTVIVGSNLNISATPSNTTICKGSSVNIIAGGANNYLWNGVSGTTNIYNVAPLSTTIYTLTGVSGSCQGSTTFTVNIAPKPIVSVTSSTNNICVGESLNLYTTGADSYVWANDNSLTCSITGVVATPTVNTIYTVVGTIQTGNTSCSDTKSIAISVKPKTNGTINANRTICQGGSAPLLALGGSEIEWFPTTGLDYPESNSPNASPLETTTYTVNISSVGECADVKTVTVIVNSLPQVEAGMDTTILYGDYISLTGEGDGMLKWTAGENLNCNQCSKAYVAPSNNTCYTLEVTDIRGCKNTDTRCIEVQKEFDFYMPNCFTPNGDGLNDRYNVVGSGIQTIEIHIYDRWGNLLYKSNDINEGWDGKSHGLSCKNGIYVCKVKATFLNDKSEIRFGNITMMGTGEDQN